MGMKSPIAMMANPTGSSPKGGINATQIPFAITNSAIKKLITLIIVSMAGCTFLLSMDGERKVIIPPHREHVVPADYYSFATRRVFQLTFFAATASRMTRWVRLRFADPYLISMKTIWISLIFSSATSVRPSKMI